MIYIWSISEWEGCLMSILYVSRAPRLRYISGALQCGKDTGYPSDMCLEHLGIGMLLDVHQIYVWSTSA
jgi:hypothetical protein